MEEERKSKFTQHGNDKFSYRERIEIKTMSIVKVLADKDNVMWIELT